MSYFFAMLSRLMQERRKTPHELSVEIGRRPDYLGDVMDGREAPDLGAVYDLAGAFKVDVADLLRPGSSFGFASRPSDKHWAAQVAEKALAGTLEDSRQPTAFAAPSFDDVLNWWHGDGGLLSNTGKLDDHVEIFDPPDTELLRPLPRRLGRQSLAARELNISTAEQLDHAFRNSDPAVARSVALSHAEVLAGQPKLSFRTILIDLSADHLVKLSYFRLLLPVHDGAGQRFVMNFSKAARRSEIGRETVDDFAPDHRDGPVFASLD